MSTHRRGVRPSQWPVRDLLGPETVRARFWDARVGAAAAGLLACGAAVTVVLTSGGRAMSEQTLEAPGAPLALPAPAPVPAVPPPAVPPAAAAPQVAEPRLPARDVVAPHPRSARPQHRRAAPRHRPAAPAPSARDAPVERDAAPREDRALAEQVATAIDEWEGRSGPDRPVVGWLLVPVQRPADAAALLESAGVDEPRHERGSGGRHRARDRDRDREQRVDRPQDDRGGRHRAPDGHRDDRGGRHRAPDHDDQRSAPHRFTKDDGTGRDEAGPGERGRAEIRAERADRDERDRTVHDAGRDCEERRAAERSSDDDPSSRDSDARDAGTSRSAGERASGGDRVSGDERKSGDAHASDGDVDWFSAA